MRSETALVLGLGRFGGGAAAVRHLVDQGYRVRVADSAQPETLADSVRSLQHVPRVEFCLGRADAGLLDGIDLVVCNDAPVADLLELETVTKREPKPEEMQALSFAWRVCKHVRSNAIVLARGEGHEAYGTVGVGAGQMSRVDAVKLAVEKAGERSRGSVLASDAFFPFADGLEAAAAAGVSAAIQPGGSRRDQEVIAAADKAGLAMVFTGRRHFRH